MRILFFHQFYKTPEEGGGIRSYYIVNSLVNRGHEVILVTSKSNSEKIQSEKTNSAFEKPNLKIIRLPVSWSNSMSFYQRIKSFFRFLWLAKEESKKHEFDMVYAISVPLTTGLLAIWTKKPFVFEVGDLWPAVPIQMGILRNPVLKYLSFRLEKKIYKKAELIISLSSDIQNHIYQKWPNTPNIITENFADLELFNRNKKPNNSALEINSDHGSKIICTYIGTAGIANDLMQMVNLAKLAEKKFPRIQFYIMISGKEEMQIKKAAPGNMSFIDYGSKDQVSELLAISDFNFVCYAQHSLLGTGSPNKFFDGLAAGCITLINVPGWINELIQAEDSGLFWDIEKNEELLDEMLNLHSDSIKIQQMKINSKKLAERFDKDLLCKKIVDQVEMRFRTR